MYVELISNGGVIFMRNVLWVSRPNVGSLLKYNNVNENELFYANGGLVSSGYGK